MVFIGLLQKILIKKLYTALVVSDNILSFCEYSGNVTFMSDEIDIPCVSINNINLDDANVYEEDLKTIIHVRNLTWHNKLKQHKAFKKRNKQKLNVCGVTSSRMMASIHLRRWKEEFEPTFIYKN